MNATTEIGQPRPSIERESNQGFDFDDLLQFQVITLGNKLGLSILRRALAPNKLTIREWRVLCVMFIFGPSMAREISEAAALDPAHVSRTVHQLRRRGLVALEDNPEDRRQMIVDLTDSGAKLVRKVMPGVQDIAGAVRNTFTAEEYEQLLGYLQRANDHVDRLLLELPTSR